MPTTYITKEYGGIRVKEDSSPAYSITGKIDSITPVGSDGVMALTSLGREYFFSVSNTNIIDEEYFEGTQEELIDLLRDTVFPNNSEGFLSENAVKVKLDQGELVRVPLHSIDYESVASGGGTKSQGGNVATNGDGTGLFLTIATTAGLNAAQSYINTIIYGRQVGIRFRRDYNTGAFSIVIDGIPYGVNPYMQRSKFNNQPFSGSNGNNSYDREVLYLVADDLEDIAHSVQVILYPDALVAKSLLIYGFLAEKRAGYNQRPRLDQLNSAGTLTAGFVAVPQVDASSNILKGLKAIMYYNGDSVTRTVTVQYNGITIWTATLATLQSAKLDFTQAGIIGAGNSANLSHKADAAAVVNFTTIGGI